MDDFRTHSDPAEEETPEPHEHRWQPGPVVAWSHENQGARQVATSLALVCRCGEVRVSARREWTHTAL